VPDQRHGVVERPETGQHHRDDRLEEVVDAVTQQELRLLGRLLRGQG